MKVISICCLLCFAVFATLHCGAPQTEDSKFEDFSKEYIEKLLERNPEYATSLGDHRFDHRMNDYSQAGLQAELKAQRESMESLGKIDSARLSRINQIDFRILKNNIESMIILITPHIVKNVGDEDLRFQTALKRHQDKDYFYQKYEKEEGAEAPTEGVPPTTPPTQGASATGKTSP